MVAGTFKTPCLVTVPAYLIPQWEKFINEWAPECTVAKMNGDGRNARQGALDLEADFTLTSYHNWVARPPYRNFWKRRWGSMIFDEAHRMRGRNSQWTKAVYTIDNAGEKNKGVPMWFLSGTPEVRDAGDFYPFLHLCDRGVHSSYWAFVEEHCHLSVTPWATEVGRTKDPERLYSILKQHSSRRILEGQEAPIFDDIPVELPSSVVQMIQQAKKTFTFEHPDMDVPEWYESAGVVWGRIRQMVSVPPTKVNPKMDALKGKLEDLPGERVIVAAWYRDTAKVALEAARKVRGDEQVNLFTGDVRPAAKAEAIDRYNEHSEGTIVCTIAALKEGANLQAGNHLIFLEESELPSDNEQLVGRQRRRGQTKPVIVHRIYAGGANSIDLAVRKLATKRSTDIRRVMSEYLLSK